MMSIEEYELMELLNIMFKLENSEMEIGDFRVTLQAIYDLIEGYYGYASEIEDFVINEDGDIIPHSITEYQSFCKSIYKTILELYMKKILSETDIAKEAYQKGYEDGKVDGYQGRDRIADIEEDVQTYR